MVALQRLVPVTFVAGVLGGGAGKENETFDINDDDDDDDDDDTLNLVGSTFKSMPKADDLRPRYNKRH